MKVRWHHKITIMTILCVTQSPAKILRNNALMNKMVSHFQQDNYLPLDQDKPKEPENFGNAQQNFGNNHENPTKVMSLMQNVLCRNFPTIPCKMITEDETLRNLIDKSIQQIKHKTIDIEKTTSTPEFHITLFPAINSEDLSNFLQVRRNTFYNGRSMKEDSRASKKQKNIVNHWSQERVQKPKKFKKDSKRTTMYSGRKKIRKFYPHKIKYKDKNSKNGRKDFMDDSDERLSMSVEDPDLTLTKRHEHLSYRVEPADPPVWRIDYMKHGEPSLNKLGYEDDRLKGKLVKTGPSVIVDENVLEQGARKEVLHPDVYIKKNFLRKTPVDINSEGGD